MEQTWSSLLKSVYDISILFQTYEWQMGLQEVEKMDFQTKKNFIFLFLLNEVDTQPTLLYLTFCNSKISIYLTQN